MSILETGPTFSVGDSITFNLTFDAGVTVTAGSSRLKLAVNRLTDDAYAIATSTSTSTGAATFSFTYVVLAGDYSDSLNYSGASALTGVTGYTSGLSTLSTTGLKVSTPLLIRSVTATPSGGTFKAGDNINLLINLNRYVKPNLSSAAIALATGTPPRSASNLSVPNSRASSIAVNYNVQTGDLSSDLDYVGIGSFTFGGDFGESLITNSLSLPTPGTTGSLSQTSNLIIDGVAPALTITPPASPQRIAPLSFALSASEAVTGLVAGDFSTAGPASLISIAGSGSSYTVAVTPVSGLTLNTATNAGATSLTTASNPNLVAGQPLVIGGQQYVAAANSSGSGPYTITLTSGLTTNTASGTSIFTDNGTSITLNTANNAASDAAGNQSGTIPSSGPVLYDPVAPIASVPTDSSPAAGVAAFTITFSEPVATVIQTSGLTVSNGTVTSINGSGNPTFVVSIARTQPLAATTLRVNANAVSDAAGNGSLVSGVGTSTPANTALLVSSIMATNGTYKIGDAVDILVTLDKPVTVAGTGATLRLETGTSDRDATYVSATTNASTTALRFRYTVQSGDISSDLDCITVPFSPGSLTFDGRNDLVLTFPVGATLGALANTSAVIIDGVAPTLNLPNVTTPQKLITSLANLPITVSSDETVTGFDISDIGATNASTSLTVSGQTYSMTLVPTAPGTISSSVSAGSKTVSIQSASGSITLAAGAPVAIGTATYQVASAVTVTSTPTAVSLTTGLAASFGVGTPVYVQPISISLSCAAGSARDEAGNLSLASTPRTLVFDPVAPVATVTPPVALVSGRAVFLVTFNEAVSGVLSVGNLTLTNVVLTGADAPTVASLNTQTFEVSVKPTNANSPVKLQVNAGAVTDTALNANLASDEVTFTPNTQPPVLTIEPTPAASTTKPLVFSITSSETVTGLALDDFTITNGTAPILTGSNSSYTLTVDPVSVLVVDTLAPVGALQLSLRTTNGSIVLDPGTPLRIDTQTVIVNEETPVTLTTTANSFAIRGQLSTAIVAGTPAWLASGQRVDVSIRASAVTDAGGLPNAGATGTKTYDFIAPSVTSVVAISSDTGRSYDVTFSEDIIGLQPSSLTITGGTVSAVLPPSDPDRPRTWFIIVQPNGSPVTSMSIQAGSAVDAAGNGIAASGPYLNPDDTSEPVVTLTGPSADTSASPLLVQVATSKPVTGLVAGDFSVLNGTAGRLDTTASGYLLQVTPVPVITLAQPASMGASAIRCSATVATELGISGAVRIGNTVYRLAADSTSLVGTSPTLITFTGSLTENQAAGAAVWPARGQAITVSLPAGSCTDSGLRGNAATDPITMRYDPTAPIFTITPAASLDSQGRVVFAVSPSEQVNTLDATKLEITQGSLVSVSQPSAGSTTWSVLVTPTGSQSASLAIQAGASVDAAGNASLSAPKTVAVIAPLVSQVTARNADGTYGIGLRLRIQVRFSEPVNVIGVPTLQLALGTNRKAVYVDGSGSADLLFDYIIAAGDSAADLDYFSSAALALGANVTIRDADGNDARLTLPAPGAAGSLSANANLRVDTGQTTDPAKPDVDGQASSGGCGAGSGIALALGAGWLGLSLIRRRRAA